MIVLSKQLHMRFPVLLAFLAVVFMALPVQKLSAQEEGPSFSKLVLAGFEAENAKDYRKANELYGQALKIRDDSPAVWIRKAHTAGRLGMAEEVAEELKIAMTKPPISMTDYLTLSWFRATVPFRSMRDGTLAVAFAQKALQEKESIEAYDALAAGYAEMGEYGKARKFAMQGIKRFPASSRIDAMKARVELYNERKTFREEWGPEGEKFERQVEKSLQNS